MRRPALLAALAAAAVTALVLPLTAGAGEPPDQNDPCSRDGRNVCGTNGVGFYDNYRYGLRWFGDFRGSIPGAEHAFCVDLRYWYPSKEYPYRELTDPVLRNREGEIVRLVNRQKIAYAMWTYGRSSIVNRQAAVMLYVHGLMGDSEPGEVDPRSLDNPAVTSWYTKVARDAERFHGPYRIETSFRDTLTVGQKAIATIRVRSVTGDAVPNVGLALSARGNAELPNRAQTNDSGVARVEVTATKAGDLNIDVRTEPIAATLPRVFVAVPPKPARNGQRLAVPSSQQVSSTINAEVGALKITATTSATPKLLVVGETVTDVVKISGALDTYRGTVAVRIFGPFRAIAQIRCDGTPIWKGSFKAKGSGTYRTAPVEVGRPGYYMYQEEIPGDANHLGFLTPCRDPAEMFKVDVRPGVRTIVSAQKTAPGTPIHDRVIVEGLNGEAVTVQAALYGPFGSRDAIVCTGKPVWSGTLEVPQDGEYKTADVTLSTPGYYTYRESIAAGGFVRAVQTPCADAAETTIVTGAPRIRTRISTQGTRPGAMIKDRVIVTGLGALDARVKVELFGPFAREGAIRCTGTPYWQGSFVAKGDGTYTTAPVRLDRAGYYTYRESVPESGAWTGTETECGLTAETTFAWAQPVVTTVVSRDVVLPGARIYDRIRVRGLGKTPAVIQVELFGPFNSRAGIRCAGKPLWTGSVTARGDGEIRSPSVKVKTVGFYTYRERIAGSDLIRGTVTECGLVEETALVRPLVLTGRGDRSSRGAVDARAARDGRRPVQIEYAALGINAPVGLAGIDPKRGALRVSPNIHRTAWWHDGARPGDAKGAVLIAGHVDSATAGPGAFYSLKNGKRGEKVRVKTASGRTITYRVVSVREYRKEALPADVYSLKGRHRLVLVTCGGPFNERLGHYRDNIVVTAVRA